MKNIKNTFKNYGIEITDEMNRRFEKYYHTLVETNKVLNLTAIVEEEDVLYKHFLDSVLPIHFFKKNATVVDVGSGAGFPGIPIKIVRTDLKMVLVDSLNKRINFLNNTIELLGLNEISAIHSRAEEFAKQHREKFDYVTARAVAPLNTLAEYLLPLVKVGGYAVIYKSTKLEEEIKEAQNALKVLGGKVEIVKNFTVKEMDLERNVLIVKKIKQTPSKYPRDKNKPKLSPL